MTGNDRQPVESQSADTVGINTTSDGNSEQIAFDRLPYAAQTITTTQNSNERSVDNVLPRANFNDGGFIFEPLQKITLEQELRSMSLPLAKTANAANPEKFISDAIDGAKKLLDAPREDKQRLFTEIISGSIKDHPEAAKGFFSRLLNSALNLGSDSSLLISTFGPVAVLSDKNNSGSIIASAFQGDGKDTLERDFSVYTAASNSARILDEAYKQIKPSEVDSFNSSYLELISTLKSHGMLEPLAVTSAREKPANPDYVKQLEDIRKIRPGLTESEAAELLLAANSVAFAPGTEMQSRFTQAIDRLLAGKSFDTMQHKALNTSGLVHELTKAMNIVTNSGDFSLHGENLSLIFLRDARQRSESNKNGMVGIYNLPTYEFNTTAFDTVISMRNEILKASKQLKPSPGISNMGNDVLATMRLIPKS
ncbi:hypothetical protein KA183_10920 [bacterium]|nr:hypothetical protein [bacterium]